MYVHTSATSQCRHHWNWGIGCIREQVIVHLCQRSQPHFDTFHQLLIIAEALWSEPVLQVVKQVEGAQSKVRTVRMVVKQLCVQMLQQCSSASSCMQTSIVTEERYTRCHHSTLFVLNGTTQLFQCFAIQNMAEVRGSRLLWHRHIKTHSQYNKCISSSGDYTEKPLMYTFFYLIKFFHCLFC
jgi:hypothetical protein